MAYSEVVVTAVTDIPAEIAAFAAARGWTVSGNNITRPGGGKQFDITATIGGTNNREHRLFVTDNAAPTQRCWTQMPWTNGTVANPVVLTPTKLHLFGNNTPWAGAPYIGCVIECGFNAYRHVYIGNAVKFGDYTGGELICANYFPHTITGSPAGATVDYIANAVKTLFSARHNAGSGGNGPVGLDAGGMNIVHAGNSVPWRRFDGPGGVNARLSFAGNEVLGGAADSINSGLLRRGVSDYAGSNIFVPVNLYCPDSAQFGSDVRFRPLGFAAGIRMVDMRGLDPGQVVEVGNDDWRVFPEFSKRTAVTALYGTSRADGGAGGYYPIYETSHMLGLAYPEGD